MSDFHDLEINMAYYAINTAIANRKGGLLAGYRATFYADFFLVLYVAST